MRALARREYCAAEIRKKLQQRGFTDSLIGHVITRLEEENWLNDRRFAEAFLHSRLKRGETPWLAAQKARARGVDEQALEEALASVTSEFDALAACRELLARRDPQGLRFSSEREWLRQARFLRNKGFNAATILQTLKESKPNEDETNQI